MKVSYDSLYEFGFDQNMVDVYIALLHIGRGSIKDIQAQIKEKNNLSYSQMYHTLRKLEKKDAVESQKGFENSYTPVNPEILLEKVKSIKINDINRVGNYLGDIYKRSTTDFGFCTIQTNFFFFLSIDLGYKIIADRFLSQASESIVLLSPPPDIIYRLKWSLLEAYEHGTEIEIHYSKFDFEETSDYELLIKENCSNIRFKLIERQYRLHEAVAIDDEYTRVGHLIIDKKTLIDFPYYKKAIINGKIEYGIDFFNGFYHAESIVAGLLKSMKNNPIIRMYQLIPAQEAQLIDYINLNGPTSSSELSDVLKISGTNLKEIIQRLQKLEKIEISNLKQGRGRPKRVISLK